MTIEKNKYLKLFVFDFDQTLMQKETVVQIAEILGHKVKKEKVLKIQGHKIVIFNGEFFGAVEMAREKLGFGASYSNFLHQKKHFNWTC